MHTLYPTEEAAIADGIKPEDAKKHLWRTFANLPVAESEVDEKWSFTHNFPVHHQRKVVDPLVVNVDIDLSASRERSVVSLSIKLGL